MAGQWFCTLNASSLVYPGLYTVYSHEAARMFLHGESLQVESGQLYQVLDPNQSAKPKAGSQPIRSAEFKRTVRVGHSLLHYSLSRGSSAAAVAAHRKEKFGLHFLTRTFRICLTRQTCLPLNIIPSE